MKNIEVKVLSSPETIRDCVAMEVAAARLTQRAETIHNMDDFMKLYNKPASAEFANKLTYLPHPTLQKFGVISAVVVGASRRFLAQVTRHQNEVKFMSGSLQYSDYGTDADFCVPYEMTEYDANNNTDFATSSYLLSCRRSMDEYIQLVELVGHDAAGYAAPQGLRNVLMITATPFQWCHMISQRICRRNTLETRYVFLKLWQELYEVLPEMFTNCGAFCMLGECEEGKMSCGHLIPWTTPGSTLRDDFPLLMKGTAK